MKRVGLIIGVLGLSLWVQRQALAGSEVYGFGNMTCAEYLTVKVQNSDLYESAKTWTTGYLTAMGQQLAVKDLLAGTDMNGAADWLARYCEQNPADRFYTANYRLVMFLQARIVRNSKSGS
jgi:hypothetical protein